MFTKAIILLVCQLALAFALPAVSTGSQKDVQRLIDELQYKGPVENKHDVVVVPAPQPEPVLVNDEVKLQQYLQDPIFVQQLKQFLVQFLNMYNNMNAIRDGNVKTTVVNEENVDVNSLLKNPSFFSFLSNFFNNQNQPGGVYGFFSQLFNQRPSAAVTTTVVSETVRPAESPVPAEVTVTHLPSYTPDNIDAVINKLENDAQEKPVEEPVVKNPEPAVVPVDRFGGSEVTITHLSPTAAGDLINSINNPNEVIIPTRPVVVNKFPPTEGTIIENWNPTFNNKVPVDLAGQIRNAKYQYATVVNDGINGNYQQKAELRNNGVVVGKYSYDDGFFWRTVEYQADAGGYRVTKEEVLPSHMKQLTGEAQVQTLMDNNLVSYKISAKDIPAVRKQPSKFNFQ